MSLLNPDHIRASLLRHAEVNTLIEPASLKIRRLGEGTTNLAYIVSSEAPQKLVVRTPKSGEPSPEEVAMYNHEQALHQGPLKVYPHKPKFHYLDTSPTLHIVEDLGSGHHPPQQGRDWSDAMVSALGTALGKLHEQTLRPVATIQTDMQPDVQRQHRIQPLIRQFNRQYAAS